MAGPAARAETAGREPKAAGVEADIAPARAAEVEPAVLVARVVTAAVEVVESATASIGQLDPTRLHRAARSHQGPAGPVVAPRRAVMRASKASRGISIRRGRFPRRAGIRP